jgi:Uma2 family endonuclease
MTPATATPVTYGLDASIPRFSVARYQKMIETGILTPEDKVELLENYVVLKTPRNPLHDGIVQVITEALTPKVPTGWRVRIQSTVVLDDSQPEPDFAVVRGEARTYVSRHPAPADVGVLIEVADSSLLRDQRDKTRIYARANIACYWIVNLVDMRVEVFTQPSVPSYGSFATYQPGDSVPLLLDGVTVADLRVDEMLP